MRPNMPGFTAETSLPRTGEHYRDTAVWANNSGELAVIPQQFAHYVYGPCIPIFYCEDPTGCHVVGHKRRRCLQGSSGTPPFGCSWVSC